MGGDRGLAFCIVIGQCVLDEEEGLLISKIDHPRLKAAFQRKDSGGAANSHSILSKHFFTG